MLTKAFRELEQRLYGRDLREQGYSCSIFLIDINSALSLYLTSLRAARVPRENRIWHRRLLHIADLKNRCDYHFG